jgi:hypothetical protein
VQNNTHLTTSLYIILFISVLGSTSFFRLNLGESEQFRFSDLFNYGMRMAIYIDQMEVSENRVQDWIADVFYSEEVSKHCRLEQAKQLQRALTHPLISDQNNKLWKAQRKAEKNAEDFFPILDKLDKEIGLASADLSRSALYEKRRSLIRAYLKKARGVDLHQINTRSAPLEEILLARHLSGQDVYRGEANFPDIRTVIAYCRGEAIHHLYDRKFQPSSDARTIHPVPPL